MILNNNKKYPWFKYYKNMKCSLKYPDTSMYAMVKKTASKYPGSIAYSYYGTRITYRTFLRKIDEAAESFARIGVVKGTCVSICMPNTPEAITCFYALNKIGAVANMIHPLSSEEEIKFSVNLVNSKYIVVSDLVYSKIYSIKDEVKFKKIIYVSMGESMNPVTRLGYMLKEGKNIKKPREEDVIPYHRFIWAAKFNRNKVVDKNKGSDVSVILHSGGTTGTPKGIELTNLNFNALVLGEIEINKVIGPKTTMLAIMPIFHGFGLGCTFHAIFSSGAEAIILPTVNPKNFDSTILKYKPNIIACVPSVLETVTTSKKLKDEDLSFIKCIICGGDTLSESLNTRMDNFLFDHGSDVKVRTAFGMTECTAGITMTPLEESKAESVGIPMPDSFIKIVKPGTHIECKPGEIGEICISGPTLMKGYVNNPKETELMLQVHEDKKTWLHSGDLGTMDEDGFVYFKSRQKRMIVSSGYNIYPGQIEKIINEHPYVDTCAVVGVPHPYKKEVAKAYIVLKNGIELNGEVKKSIKEHCEKNIAKYALPYAYGYRKELPKTLVGKVAYRDLIDDKGEDDEV